MTDQTASAAVAAAFAQATVRTATPLILASTGELLVERAGLINIGLEGVILSGAFGALVGATHWGGGSAFGLAVSAFSGMLIALIFAALWALQCYLVYLYRGSKKAFR